MEENGSSSAKSDSIAHTDRKRKLQDELTETPLPKKIQSNQSAARGVESDPESASSNNFNSDPIMYTDDESKSNPEYPETCSSDMPSTSSSRSFSSFDFDFSCYSSESTSSSDSSCNGPESSSSNEQPDRPHDEGRSGQFGKRSDYSSIDQQCMELENLLCSNGAAPNSNYILSSGRCLVNQDDQKEAKKLTIDKEFEQYFSTLML